MATSAGDRAPRSGVALRLRHHRLVDRRRPVDAHGPASIGRVLLFAAGAASAYGCLRFLAETVEGEANTALTRSTRLVRAGAIHVLAIAVAISAAALIAQIDSAVSWLLASFAATVLYLGVSSVEMALLAHEHDGHEEHGE